MDSGTLHARREARRRAIRRRRRVVAGTLAVVAVAAVAAVAAMLAGGTSGSSSSSGVPARQVSVGASSSTGRTASTSTRARVGTPGKEPVPILMYHVIAPAARAAPPTPACTCAPAEFAEQMQASRTPAGTR